MRQVADGYHDFAALKKVTYKYVAVSRVYRNLLSFFFFKPDGVHVANIHPQLVGFRQDVAAL